MLRQDAGGDREDTPGPADLMKLGSIHFTAATLATCAVIPGYNTAVSLMAQGALPGGMTVQETAMSICIGAAALRVSLRQTGTDTLAKPESKGKTHRPPAPSRPRERGRPAPARSGTGRRPRRRGRKPAPAPGGPEKLRQAPQGRGDGPTARHAMLARSGRPRLYVQ